MGQINKQKKEDTLASLENHSGYMPQINPLSERIVSALDNREAKIEDRLYQQHHIRL